MKKLFSMLLAIVLVCGTVHAASFPSPSDGGNAAHGKSAVRVTRTIGGAKEMISTISEKTASDFVNETTRWENVNEDYNEYDVAKLREFLEIEDENGVKNGEKIVRIEGDYYDPDDPSTWSCLGWTPEGDLHHIRFWSINFAEYDGDYPVSADDLLVGTLDVSGMQGLVDVNIPDNLIDGVIADNCPSLEMFYCGNMYTLFGSRCTTVSAKNCPNLVYIGADYCIQSSVEIEGCNSIDEIMMDYTRNLSLIDFEDCRDSVQWLGFHNTGLASVDLSYMTALVSAQFDDSHQLKAIDLTGNVSDFEVSISGTSITELDLSDCINLNGLYIMDTGIEELDLTACSNLQALVCYNTNIRILDAQNSDSLFFLNTMVDDSQEQTPFHDAVYVSPYGNLLSLAAVNGNVGLVMGLYYYSNDTISIGAAPKDPSQAFLGWFEEGSGELVSNELTYSFDESMISRMQNGDLSLIARFSGGEALPGDVNGDGAVTAEDAILALRCAMHLIELTDEQLSVGDVDGNGTLNITDAIIILRTAMGLIG